MFVNQKRFLLKRTTKRNSLLRHDMGSLPRQTTTDVLNSQSVVEEAVFRSLFRFCNFLVSTRTPDTFDAYVFVSYDSLVFFHHFVHARRRNRIKSRMEILIISRSMHVMHAADHTTTNDPKLG
jgi:hypothetical protein